MAISRTLARKWPAVAVAVAVAVAALALLRMYRRRGERYANYRECKNAECGGKGRCRQCKAGNWKSWKNWGGGDGGGKRDRSGGGKRDRGGGGDQATGGGGGGDGGGWRPARITCFAPTNRFAFGKGDSANMVAVHEKDKDAYANKNLEIRWPGGKTKVLRVGDYCADKDCGGCCSTNANTHGGFLLDVNRDSLPGGTTGDPCWAEGEFRVV
jgi:hypothetical protein